MNDVITSGRAWVVDLERMEYGQAWDLQRRIHAAVADKNMPDTLLLVEHDPVYTIGRGAHGSRQHVLVSDEAREQMGIALYEVDRGGDVTYHGPGQQVGYPILHLDRYQGDLLVYLRRLEAAFIDVLADFGLRARRIEGYTGVWVADEKVVAIGVKASRGVTMHGFACNVDPNLAHFAGIVPCGIQGMGVSSLARLTGRAVTLADVRPHLLRHLGASLGVEWESVGAADVLAQVSVV
jgi:lipoyl(octanoyl) transferase